jgi:Starch binding domain
MVGNMGLLGNWDPMRAVPLTTTNETYPVWTIKIDMPRDKIIEYKYLIIKAQNKKQNDVQTSGRGLIEWENLPQGINRLISTHGKKEITI